MKNLIISIVCLLVLMIPWLMYDKYSTAAIHSYSYILAKQVIPAVKSSDWETAEAKFAEISDDWKSFETISEYFLDTQAVNEADELINKTRYYIQLQDPSNAAACSSELIHLLNYLHENEILSTGNIL